MLQRQGDIFIETLDRMPAEARQAPLPHGVLVHGEITGHSHRIEDLATAAVFASAGIGEMFVEVTGASARIVHEEHGPIELTRGLYRVWRQRDYSPEAAGRAARGCGRWLRPRRPRAADGPSPCIRRR